MDNISPNGNLNNGKAARAILQYRNTPLPEIGLSPAQILFHRQLRDQLPTNPQHYKLHQQWLLSAEKREQQFCQRNQNIITSYNEHAHPLPPLTVQTHVVIQNLQKKDHLQWQKSGTIVETLPFRQYKIRLHGSGRIVLRNRRHIKPCINPKPPIIPSAGLLPLIKPVNSNPERPTTIHHPESPTPMNLAAPEIHNNPITYRIPRSLRNLADYSAPGLLEGTPLLSRGRDIHE